MAKRPRLSEAFAPAPPAEPEPETAPAETTPAVRPPSRVGLRAVTVYVDPAAHRQLRILAVEQDRPSQELMVEALNDLFQKYDKPRIA